jgi:two-component system cell cycle sensor histidine kinase/response regulator CckA
MPESARLPRVLVVDDEDSVRRVAALGLKQAGYDVEVASDGAQALRIVGEQPPFDVFVIDVIMPQMSGQELARQLRLADPDVKVLYFTGYADRLFEERPTLWEHEAYVEKPISFEGLREAVSLLLYDHTRGPAAPSDPRS